MNTKNYGATPDEWDHFSFSLGLTQDLLPVVSNPGATISSLSKMKGLGKTPSKYNRSKEAVGIADWTNLQSSMKDVDSWRTQSDYGICLQTRTVRALDIDVDNNQALANQIVQLITDTLGFPLPARYRENSSKVLLAFNLAGDMPKRIIRLDGGIIEMLATGQQFIACGTHPSGARYQWLTAEGAHELPSSFPEVTLEQLDAVWAALAKAYAIEPPTSSTAPSKAKKLAEATSNDPVAAYLLANDRVKSTEKDGRLHIVCPFEHEHTSESADSATTYFPANTGGYQFGHFDCKHAHCEHRTDQEFKDAIGIPYQDPANDFDVITPSDQPVPTAPPRFTVVPASEFSQGKPPKWIVKGILPQADLGVIYGDSGSGKTFAVLDISGAIAQGKPWRGRHVNQGRIVFICAEGAGGMRSRLAAYSSHHGVSLADLPIGIIADAPNFMEVSEVKAVYEAIKTFGEVSVIVVDTFAQVMAGANENSGEDVGKALKHCRALHKHTGALVLLVHHSGKDASKGARGWSGLRAAADVELEVFRDGDDRVLTVTKLKDGIDGSEMGFKLKDVQLGLDEDGEPFSSCVVEYVDGEPQAKRSKGEKAKRAGHNELLVLRSLDKLIGLGDDKVAVNTLIEEAVSYLPVDEGKRDRRREVIGRSVRTLIDDGKIEEIKGGFVRFQSDETETLGGENE